jgi:SP family xylose:H+ symportor-like MFS transporter
MKIKENKYLLFITAVATLGGLLFGYDTAVISGAIGNLGVYFQLTDAQVGWAASSALIGCVIGAMGAGFFSTRIGRKRSMILAALLFFVSALGTALADDFSWFIVFRIVGGAGVGLASMLSPMYIAEIAPAKIRGRLVSMNQFAIIIGILVVYIVNYYIVLQGDDVWNQNFGWRWMFGSESIPALLFFTFSFFIPNSPRWLMSEQRFDESLAILTKISGREEASRVFSSIKNSLDVKKPGIRHLFRPNMKMVMIVGIGLAVFQQVTGINVFFYYAPEIFKGFGNTPEVALLQTILLGATNLIFTVVAIALIDRVGRKRLLLAGSVGMVVCLFIIGYGAYSQNVGTWLLIFMLGYIASFAVSWGPVVWVVVSEIFPNNLRSIAMSVAVLFVWLANFVVSQTFPMMDGNSVLQEHFRGAFPFWLYGVMGILSFVFVKYYVPETKNKSLEEIEEMWIK